MCALLACFTQKKPHARVTKFEHTLIINRKLITFVLFFVVLVHVWQSLTYIIMFTKQKTVKIDTKSKQNFFSN
jgi:hypothetical protein